MQLLRNSAKRDHGRAAIKRVPILPGGAGTRPFALLWLAVSAAILMQAETPQRQPVLVELFTSEGCSSCPPADALLEQMDHNQPIAGAQLIVLSEHVDYWNHDGWVDPYSSKASTARQEAYAHRFNLNGPYTPEMIVDGVTEFVGSDARKAETAIRNAMHEPTVPIRIVPAEADQVTVEVDPFPAGQNHKANIYIAHAADSGDSDVLRGENQGRHLHHVAIVKEIQQIGKMGGHGSFEKRVPVPAGSRLIVFAQDPSGGQVFGAAMYAKP